MALRQIWLFLDEVDIAPVVALLEGADPGVTASWGRYLRGDPRALLDGSAALERREALPGERKLYLFHKRHSVDVVAHLMPAGPFAGLSQLDEERSDCLILRIPDPVGNVLEPARLYAHTSLWRGSLQTKKRHPFTRWANASLKLLLSKLGLTGIRFMRVGPGTRALAVRGERTLSYLLRPVSPVPPPGPLGLPVVQAPDGTLDEDDSTGSH